MSNCIPIDTEKEMTVEDTIDFVWLLTSSFLILTMQAGFAIYESSLIRGKNFHNVLLKNLLDGSIAAIFWMAFGYGIAFGCGNSFLGLSKFMSIGISKREFSYLLFQYSFSATASTIMSGAVAERVNFFSYMIMCGFINSFIYAFAAHWVWSSDGWLKNWQFIDFAGCSVVHVLGGFSGLAGALFIGPRIGKFEITSDSRKISNQIPMSSPGQTILGVLVLMWGWYGFNGGSSLRISGDWYAVAGLACLNTAFSSSAGAVGGLTFSLAVNRKEKFVDIIDIGNGVLAGLVGITASAATVSFWEAIFIGFTTSWIVLGTARLVEHHQLVDDPVSSFSVHGIGGSCGLIWAGLFAQSHHSGGMIMATGAFYGNPIQLGKQIAGILVISSWSFIMTYILCFMTDRYLIKLRITEQAEKMGLDLYEHRIGYATSGINQLEELFSALKESDKSQEELRTMYNNVDQALNVGYVRIKLPKIRSAYMVSSLKPIEEEV